MIAIGVFCAILEIKVSLISSFSDHQANRTADRLANKPQLGLAAKL